MVLIPFEFPSSACEAVIGSLSTLFNGNTTHLMVGHCDIACVITIYHPCEGWHLMLSVIANTYFLFCIRSDR